MSNKTKAFLYTAGAFILGFFGYILIYVPIVTATFVASWLYYMVSGLPASLIFAQIILVKDRFDK